MKKIIILKLSHKKEYKKRYSYSRHTQTLPIVRKKHQWRLESNQVTNKNCLFM